MIDEFRAAVSVKGFDVKRIGGDDIGQERVAMFAGKFFDGADDLPLSYFVDGIDVEGTGRAGFSALMDGINADESGLALWRWFFLMPIETTEGLVFSK